MPQQIYQHAQAVSIQAFNPRHFTRLGRVVLKIKWALGKYDMIILNIGLNGEQKGLEIQTIRARDVAADAR
jgi:hypothetical protein